MASVSFALPDRYSLAGVQCASAEPSAFIRVPYATSPGTPFALESFLRSIPLRNTGETCETRTTQTCSYVKQTVQSCGPSDSTCYCQQEERMCRGADVCMKWNTYGCDNPDWAAHDPLCQVSSECSRWEATYYPCQKTICRKEFLDCKTAEEPVKTYHSYDFSASFAVDDSSSEQRYSGRLCLETSCKGYVANFGLSGDYSLPEGEHDFSTKADVAGGSVHDEGKIRVAAGSSTVYPKIDYEMTIPAEFVELESWMDPFDFSNENNEFDEIAERIEHIDEYGNLIENETGYDVNRFTIRSNIHRFTANKTAGSNKYELDAYVFYRVLIYPDGREDVIDKNEFDNKVYTGKEPLGNGYYFYFSEHDLEEKTLGLRDIQPGMYKVELRRIRIPALTHERYPSLDVDSVVDLYDAKAAPYSNKREGYLSFFGGGPNNWNYVMYSCTQTTPREYERTGNFMTLQSKDKACPWLEMRSIKDLGCRFAYDEYRESTVYSDYGSQKDSSDSKNCWFEFLANRSVRLKDLEETIAVYEYAVNESGIADYPLNGRGDGPQQYQPEMRILPQDGSDAGPFIAATGGAGKNMLQQRTANAPAQDGLLPLAAAAGAGAVAYGCLAFGSPNLRKPEGQITEQTGPGLKAGQTEAIVKPPQNQGGKKGGIGGWLVRNSTAIKSASDKAGWVSLGLFAAGFALSLTGIGAPLGVPLMAAGFAVGAASGVADMAVGSARMDAGVGDGDDKLRLAMAPLAFLPGGVGKGAGSVAKEVGEQALRAGTKKFTAEELKAFGKLATKQYAAFGGIGKVKVVSRSAEWFKAGGYETKIAVTKIEKKTIHLYQDSVQKIRKDFENVILHEVNHLNIRLPEFQKKFFPNAYKNGDLKKLLNPLNQKKDKELGGIEEGLNDLVSSYMGKDYGRRITSAPFGSGMRKSPYEGATAFETFLNAKEKKLYGVAKDVQELAKGVRQQGRTVPIIVPPVLPTLPPQRPKTQKTDSEVTTPPKVQKASPKAATKTNPVVQKAKSVLAKAASAVKSLPFIPKSPPKQPAPKKPAAPAAKRK